MPAGWTRGGSSHSIFCLCTYTSMHKALTVGRPLPMELLPLLQLTQNRFYYLGGRGEVAIDSGVAQCHPDELISRVRLYGNPFNCASNRIVRLLCLLRRLDVPLPFPLSHVFLLPVALRSWREGLTHNAQTSNSQVLNQCRKWVGTATTSTTLIQQDTYNITYKC